MRAATVVWATAILILVSEVWAREAGAENPIKPGKWEFWTVGSKISEPPPGTQLPPSVRWGPEVGEVDQLSGGLTKQRTCGWPL